MIIPVLHRLLVKQDKLEEVDETIKRAKAAGLEIPVMDGGKAQATVDKGVIVALGGTAFKDFNTEAPVQVGDRIAYAKFAGKFIKDSSGEEFLLINDEDVVCILKD